MRTLCNHIYGFVTVFTVSMLCIHIVVMVCYAIVSYHWFGACRMALTLAMISLSFCLTVCATLIMVQVL